SALARLWGSGPAGGALPVALVGALFGGVCVSLVVSPAEVRAPSSHSLVLAADAARPCRDGGFASTGGDGCYAGRPGLSTRGDLVHGGWALCAVRRLRRACAGRICCAGSLRSPPVPGSLSGSFLVPRVGLFGAAHL